jgi:hypothetical protein
MKNIFNEIKWAYQRVVRGYDDRIFWGFDGYLCDFLKPLKEFCTHYLTLEQASLNPQRVTVYKHTLKLIKKWEVQGGDVCDFNDKSLLAMWSYIGKHINWYWD